MPYEKPSFVEIKMDAEIGSYQADYDPTGPNAPIAFHAASSPSSAAPAPDDEG